MVGNEEGIGHKCTLLPGICRAAKSWGVCEAGTCIFERRYSALARKSRAAHGDAKDQAAAKAGAEAGLHDAGRSCKVSLVRKTDTPSGEVLSYRVVYGEPPQRDNGPEVVDGES